MAVAKAMAVAMATMAKGRVVAKGKEVAAMSGSGVMTTSGWPTIGSNFQGAAAARQQENRQHRGHQQQVLPS